MFSLPQAGHLGGFRDTVTPQPHAEQLASIELPFANEPDIAPYRAAAPVTRSHAASRTTTASLVAIRRRMAK